MSNMEIIEKLGVELSMESGGFTKQMQNINKAIKNADKEFNQAKKGVKDFEKSFTGLDAAITKNRKQIDNYTIKLEQQQKEFDDLNEKLEEHQKELKKIEEEQGKGSKAWKDQAEKVSKYADSIVKLNLDMDKTKKALTENTEALQRNKEKYDNLGKTLETTDSKIEDIVRIVDEAQKEFDELTADIKETESVFSKIESTVNKFKNQIDTNNKALELYDTKINELNTELRENEQAHKKLGNEIKTLENELTQAKTQYGESSNEARELSTKLNSLKDDFLKLSNEIEGNKQDLDKYQTEVTNTKTKLETLSKGIREVPWKQMQQDLEQTKDKLEGVADKLESFTNKLAILGGISLVAFGEASNATSKFQGALGLTTEEAEKLTKTAQDLNKRGFDFGQAQDSIIKVKQTMSDLLDPSEVEDFTADVLALAETFDIDMNDTIKTVSSMMRNFGTTGKESLDIITWGLQNGLDVSGDFLDTLWEYAPQFADMGFTAEETLQILNKGMKEGAFNTDKLADGVKEFRIRLSEVGETQEKALKSLGLNVKEVTKAFNEGGEEGKNMAVKVAMELMKVEDETKRNELAVALFGTMYEDVGNAVVESLGGINTEQLNVKGTTDEMTQAFEESFGAKLRAKLAELKPALESIGEALIPVLDVVGDLITKFADWFSSLDEGTIKTITNFGLFAVAVIPVIKTVMGVINTVKGAITIMGGLSSATATTGGAVGGLGGALGTLSGVALPIAIGLILALGNALGDNEQALLMLQEKFGGFGIFLSGTCEFISGVWDITIGFIIDSTALLFDVLGAMMDGPGGLTVSEAWDRFNQKLEQRSLDAYSKLNLHTTQGLSQMRNATVGELNNVNSVYEVMLGQIPNITGNKLGEASKTLAKTLQGMSSTELTILQGMNDQTKNMFDGINKHMTVEQKAKQLEKNINNMKKAGLIDTKALETGITNGMNVINQQLSTKSQSGTSKATQEFDKANKQIGKSMDGIERSTSQGMGNSNNDMQREATAMYKGVSTSYHNMEKKGKQHATDLYKGTSTSASRMSESARQHASTMYRGVTTSTGRMASEAISDWNRIRRAYSVPIRGTITKTTINRTKAIPGAETRNIDANLETPNMVRTIQAMHNVESMSNFNLNHRYFNVSESNNTLSAKITSDIEIQATNKLLMQLIGVLMDQQQDKGENANIIIQNILDGKLISEKTINYTDRKLGERKQIKNQFKGVKRVVKA